MRIRFVVILVAWWCGPLLFAATDAQELPELPGPALDLPVDLDGDGVSTWGDVYVFNYWLALGGNFASALKVATVKKKTLDISAFMDSKDAALTRDAALLIGSATNVAAVVGDMESPTTFSAGSGQQADAAARCSCCACTSSGVLQGVFDQSVSQLNTVLCDDTLFDTAAGQAVRTVSGTVFIARRSDVINGGVTRVTGLSNQSDGRIPISCSQATNVLSGLCASSKLAYDAANDQLLLTLKTDFGNACTVGLFGQVKRLSNLAGATLSACEEVAAGVVSTFNPDGVAVFKQNMACDATIGDVIVSNHKPFFDAFNFGALRLITSNGCIAGAIANQVLKGLDSPSGLDIGNFNGAGALGIYFGNRLATPGQWEIRRSLPRVLPAECSWDLGDPPPHAVIPTSLGIEAVVFDPFSPSMFVSDADQNIWRVRATAGSAPVLFANNLNHPLGLSLIDTGVMLVSEEGKLTVIDGWRFKFKRGDADKNLTVQMADATLISNWLFIGGPAPTCWDAADANDDARINISDSVFLANFLSNGGPPPPAPGPTTMGVDPTGDLFGCRQYVSSGEIQW